MTVGMEGGLGTKRKGGMYKRREEGQVGEKGRDKGKGRNGGEGGRKDTPILRSGCTPEPAHIFVNLINDGVHLCEAN